MYYFCCMLIVSQLFVYPVKSLGGVALNTARLTSRGLQYDRRWMLIDHNNRFLSQRENARMALFKTRLDAHGLTITYTPDASSLYIPFKPLKQDTVQVTIWDDTCTGQLVSDEADAWFTHRLNSSCRLVYMADNVHRQTDLRYTAEGTITSFADAYPLLMIGQASLDDLNSRLTETLPMNRFRPNVVFTGGTPYMEDTMQHFMISGINLFGVKLCARCVMTTIDQDSAQKNKEPLKTLSTYRSKNNKILFGQNITAKDEGMLCIGDEIKVLSWHTTERFVVT